MEQIAKKSESWKQHPFQIFILGGLAVFILFILIGSFGGFGSTNTPLPISQNSYPQPASPCADFNSVKTQAEAINFKELDKNIDSFNGRIVKFTGQVLQIQESNNRGAIRLAVTKSSYGWSSNDVIWVDYQNHTDALQDDEITVYGQLTGPKTYTSQTNFQVTIPSMFACVIENQKGKGI